MKRNFITCLKKTGTHRFKLEPDPRTEKFLELPLSEGKKLIQSGETAILLLERMYKFALRQALIDFASVMDMGLFEETVTEIVSNEVAYARAESSKRREFLSKRRELLGKLIEVRKQCAATFTTCRNQSVYIKQFGLLDDKIGLFSAKRRKAGEGTSPSELFGLIRKNPELKATHEELQACLALIGKQTTIDGYVTSRQRLFEPTLTKGNVLYRILVQNFDIFISNLVTYRLNSANPAFLEMISQEGRTAYFKLNQYTSFISQEGIDEYNAMLNGKAVLAAGVNQVTPSLNRAISEYNDKHAKDDGFIRLKGFKPLYKQILGITSSDEVEKQVGFQTISSKAEFVSEVEKWVGWYDQIDEMKKAIGLMDKLTNLDGLYIRQSAVNTISRLLCGSPMELRNRLTQAGCKSKELTVNERKVTVFALADLFNEQVLDRRLFSQYFDNLLKSILLEGEERSKWVRTLCDPFAGKTFLQIPSLATVIQALKDCIQYNKRKSEYAGHIERFQLVFSRFTSLMNLIVQDDSDNLVENPLRELINQHFTELMENTHYEGVLIRGYLLTKPNDKHKTPIQFGFYDLGVGWSRANSSVSGLFIVREPSHNPDSPYYYHVCCANKYLPDKEGIITEKYLNALQEKDSKDGWGLMCFNQLTPQIARAQVLYNEKFIRACKGYDDIREGLLDKANRKDLLNSKEPNLQRRVLAFVKRMLTTGPCQERYAFDPEKIEACPDINSLINLMVEEAYVLHFLPMDHEQLDKDIEAGRIFSFKVCTRKLYKPTVSHSQHEQLFLAAMSGNQGISLQGGVKVFYREPRLDPQNTFVHKSGTILLDKYDRNGQMLLDEKGKSCYALLLRYLNRDKGLYKTPLTHKKLEQAEKLYNQKKDVLVTKVFRNDIMKDARFTKPQWTIHLPLLTNRSGLEEKNENFRKLLDKQFDDVVRSGDYRILSLLFSTRNLVYLTLIDADGKIIEQRSLNQLDIDHSGRLIDYYGHIQARLRQRILIQKDLQSNVENIESSWGKEDEIKGTKEGYISQVVASVADYMRDGRTLLVMEDAQKSINPTLFDASQMTAIQRQIITKLACMRLRHTPLGEPGSVNKPISLAKQVTSNAELANRNGMVYIPDMTFFNNRIDHTTGFVNLLPAVAEMNVKQCKDLVESFDEMHYDQQQDIFKCTYTPSRLKMPKGKLSLNTDDPMTFTTKEADRIVFNGRTDGGSPIIETWDDITERIKALLKECKIPYEDGQNILPRLGKAAGRSSVHRNLLLLFKPLMRMDNYDSSNPQSEGYYSPAEGGICIKYPNAIDESRGYVLALRGMAYIYYYLRTVDAETEDPKKRVVIKPTLEELTVFFKDFASLRK